jgi:hypothetical protein
MSELFYQSNLIDLSDLSDYNDSFNTFIINDYHILPCLEQIKIKTESIESTDNESTNTDNSNFCNSQNSPNFSNFYNLPLCQKSNCNDIAIAWYNSKNKLLFLCLNHKSKSEDFFKCQHYDCQMFSLSNSYFCELHR